MQIETLKYENKQWHIDGNILDKNKINIVFIFGDREEIKSKEIFEELRLRYPKAKIIGCSSSGNILGDVITSSTMTATAISFEKGFVEMSVKDVLPTDNYDEVGHALVKALPSENLKHIFILADGLTINGSLLAEGVNTALTSNIAITGGLAGDGMNFEETWVIADDFAVQNRMVAIGFYGDSLHIGSGCYAGWEEFGIYRRITKSEGNIVYEIDGQPALDLYKKYLGEYAKNLPASGLEFPFNVKKERDSDAIIRSVLGMNEEEKSLIFVGDVAEGSYARLMKTDIDGLIDGSRKAAEYIDKINNKEALGLVVSCVGRRVVLKQLAEEELEVLGDVLGDNVHLTGFYSYGELAPYSSDILSCQLHNQTMTLTVIYED